MEIIETPLQDCYIIKPPVFGDDRGFFFESFNQKKLSDAGIDFEVKQVNFARSSKNVLRGLHYQIHPYAQSKLVGVVSGSVIDLAVDLRRNSPTFKKSFKIEISTRDTLLLIPKGFAHGYYTLEDNTIFYYAVDNFYHPESERGIFYKDEELNIDWGLIGLPSVSKKDQGQSSLAEAELFD